ncbi:MAG: hypothetical protein E2O35_06900 [Proteobacteria bacterium]|nr:MAG: hypothetical protein E2O35_06900 [Pseudomonadota bacterium]
MITTVFSILFLRPTHGVEVTHPAVVSSLKISSAALVGLAIIWCLPAPAADFVYVIDKLLVGVHQKEDLNSAIIKVLPTGTKLEIVQRKGELALVKDPNGIRGWVDAAYLMEEPTAALKVKILSDENAVLTKKLAVVSSSKRPDTDPALGKERDILTTENTALKTKLSAEKVKAGALQVKVGKLESQLAQRPVTPADTVIAEIEATNLKLNHELEAAVQTNVALQAKLDQSSGMASPTVIVASFSASATVLGSLAIVLLLAFGTGVYLTDYLNRRRHGGFRV